jgi:hypothetical protein
VYTYQSLFDEVLYTLDRVNDADFEANLPGYIQQAQAKIVAEKDFLGFQVALVGSFTTGDPVVPKPAGWRKTMSINFGTGVNSATRNPLGFRTYEYCRAYWPNGDTYNAANDPLFYADYNFDNWLVAPTPNDDNPFEAIIMMTPQDLTADNQTNWLTQYNPLLLKLAVLLVAAPTLKNDARIPMWDAMYKEQLGIQTQEALKQLVDRVQAVNTP